ncbi:fructokinase protein [Halorhabdus tiamatea SARL4B]|uniref:Fructokinase n=1 Tax=Halorhabdus tiamatea SARL4B TaxID=1033806 RepID=F7PJ84_9EURY|nr:carbohydrate kinase [Halorhabdus tiamatea]ERJ06808.1 fructokinase protein [Halorhabdus tiamatea SARL4B]CCQ33053.1 fructokinase [Halorhabdus tiamatea SARL4B]
MTDSNVLVAGEALIDLFPTESGRLADVETLRRATGGAPANVAVGMARLGSPPLLWTRLGDDPFGEHLLDVLDANGVPDSLIAVDDERKTAHTLVADDPDADQSFTFFNEGTATFAMEPGTVSDEQLCAVEWVHFGGVMLSAEPARSAMFDLVERANDHGCTVSFDPNTRADLWPDQSVLIETIERAVRLADVVKTDREDLAFLLDDPADVEATAAAISEYGPHTVLLTQGGDGAYARATEAAPWGAATADQSPFDVDVVETTGAGDAFLAGAITALQERGTLADAVEFAAGVGALATTDTGAMAALPDRDAVEALLS